MKSREELQNEIDLKNALESERALNDGRYAPKLIEKIVFWFIATLSAALIGFLLKVAFDYLTHHYH